MNTVVAVLFFAAGQIAFWFGTKRYWRPFSIGGWSLRRAFHLAAFYVLGLGLTVKGASRFVEAVAIAGDRITALGLFMLVFVLCYDPSFNNVLHLRVLRAIALIGIALTFLRGIF